jgi:hypothetical protein
LDLAGLALENPIIWLALSVKDRLMDEIAVAILAAASVPPLATLWDPADKMRTAF